MAIGAALWLARFGVVELKDVVVVVVIIMSLRNGGREARCHVESCLPAVDG